MDKKSLIQKCLTLGLILLCIGVTIAPTIIFYPVKATFENDFVEVTAQAYGMKGFEDTTVNLPRQQYEELKQYLIDFKAHLNQTTTKEEAVPIFIEAVIELNKYGLLPKEMYLLQDPKLVLGLTSNYLCMIVGNIRNGTTAGFLGVIGQILYGIGAVLRLWPIIFFGELLVRISVFLNSFKIIGYFISFLIETGNITTVGLTGIKIFNVHSILDSATITNFFGIKITNRETKEFFLLGFAGSVHQIHNP